MDRWRMPPEWRELVLPRRSNDIRREVDLDAAPEGFGKRIETHRSELVAALERAEVDAELAAAAIAHIEGEPNPAGASVLGVLLRFADERGNGRLHEQATEANRSYFAAWTREYGLPFAVCALVEDLDHDIRWGRSGPESPRFPFVNRVGFPRFKWQNVWISSEGALPLARTLTANADDQEYRRVVEAVANHRDTAVKRLAAAYLLPDETRWVGEVCDEYRAEIFGSLPYEGPWRLVGTADHVARLGERRIHPAYLNHRTVPELVVNLGVDSLAVLAGTFTYKGISQKQRALLFEGIACIPTDEAIAFLLDRVSEAQVLPAVKHAAARFPLQAARLVAARVGGFTPAQRSFLSGLLRSAIDDLPAVLDRLEPSAREAIEDLTADAALPVAEPEQLPLLLVSPPCAERRKAEPAASIPGLEAPTEIELVWEPGEYDRAMAIEPGFRQWDEAEYWGDISGHVVNQLGLGLAEGIWAQLARNGAEAADAVVERLRGKPKHGGALPVVRSVKAAALAADWLVRLKSGRGHAVTWLDRHREHAVPYLVPMAVGPSRGHRPGAQAALRYLGRAVGNDLVLKATEPLGSEAVERIQSLLEADPHEPLSAAPRPGAWADPDLLPPVMLAGGDAVLPRSAARHLVAVLSMWSPRLPYPGAGTVAAHCDRASLTRFSHALFDLWLAAGAPPADSWAVDQLGCFGTDKTVAKLAAHLVAWPGKNQADRAGYALEVLGVIGTDAAFDVLKRVADMDRFPATTRQARRLTEALAARRGTDPDAFADRRIPDLGLAEPETLVFDYGPRRFHVRFDDRLNPHLTDETGRSRRSLPGPGVRDDSATAEASRRRYKLLVKDVERIAGEQAAGLETAMLNGRTWTVPDFRRLAAHPIVSSVARRLVWMTADETRPIAFRPSEDGGLADVHERAFEPAPTAAIRLAHPALLGAELPAWIEIFADYSLLQPFEQLSRPPLTLTEDELATGRMARFEGAFARMGALQEVLTWEGRYFAPDVWDQRIFGFSRRVPGGVLLVDVDPAPATGSPDPAGRHRLTSVHLAATANRHPTYAKALPGHRLDPVTAAELLGALASTIEP